MCGRFTLTERDVASLARRWSAELDAALAAGYRPRYNVAPGDPHPVLRVRDGRRVMEPAAFGLPGPGGELLLNARVETAAVKAAFRDAWRARRCAVVADGFLEWSGPANARRPSWLTPRAGGPVLFAGLLSDDVPMSPLATASGGEGGWGVRRFAILITAANAEVSALHDRMPVLLPEALLAAWLADAPPPELPSPADGSLAIRAVSPRVNSVRNDDPACLEAPALEPQLALKLG